MDKFTIKIKSNNLLQIYKFHNFEYLNYINAFFLERNQKPLNPFF
jgi:hypothetical protein